MSWFWGGKKPQDDPTRSLKPDLQKFLDEQQPNPYIPAQAESQQIQKPAEPEENRQTAPVDPKDRPLPKESLFQDGRYKDIWSTYVPQQQTAANTKSPAERVMTAKKDRRETIHRAALENCAFEQDMQQNCFTSGDTMNKVRARMTMCRQETKAFNRCYQLQAKFLQALGYLSDPYASNEDEEKIQMHADRLYHRMMDYEAAVDDAKQNSTPIPPLSSVFNPSRPAPTIDQIKLPSNMEKLLKKPLRELPPHERELAARALLQEAKVAQGYADEMFKYTTTLNQDRKDRQKVLVNIFGDTIGKFFIPDAPEEHKVKTFAPSDLERSIWDDDSGSHKK